MNTEQFCGSIDSYIDSKEQEEGNMNQENINKVQKTDQNEIKQVRFVFSKPDVTMCPKDNLPEYAFIGRSNVGKSSLINMLAHENKLAKTSSTPGKTRLINYYLVNEAWYLVDLPGYGYAKISHTEREKLTKLIHGYVQYRKNLVCLFVLVDIRHHPLPIDLAFMEWLGVNQVPFAIVFTKCDKLAKNKIEKHVIHYFDIMKDSWENLPPHFITSAEKGSGRAELLHYIASVNERLT